MPDDAPPELATQAQGTPAPTLSAAETHALATPTPPAIPAAHGAATTVVPPAGASPTTLADTDILGGATAARFLEGTGELPAGSELGPYRIVSVLGRGGMGLVYRAVDPRLAREVALKTLPGSADRAQVERFLREARAAARLKHPGIVGVHEVNVYGGRRVIALELVEGESLAQKLAREGPLEPAAAAALVASIARSVAAAHEAGIIHRDLKPANVLLERDGRPRLTDFGLARDEKATSLTTTGEILGTPAYMSPEQARGDSDGTGPLTDVHGLGAILFETLAGRAPFTGKSAIDVIRKVAEQAPESPGSLRKARGLAPVPEALERLCLRALAKDPARRPPSAASLAADLEAFGRGELRADPVEPAVKILGEVAPDAPVAVAGPGAVDASLGRRTLAFFVDVTGISLALGAALAVLGTPSWLATQSRHDLAFSILCLAYFALLGATPGGATLAQRLVGIRITRADGGRLSLLSSLVRTLASLLVVPTIGLGFLVASQSGRTLHDRIAGSRVVRRLRRDGSVAGPSTLVLAVGAWALGIAAIVGLGVLAAYQTRLEGRGSPGAAAGTQDPVAEPTPAWTPELGHDLFDWSAREPERSDGADAPSPFSLPGGVLTIRHRSGERTLIAKRRAEWRDYAVRFQARVGPGTRASFVGRFASDTMGGPATWDEVPLAGPGEALLPESPEMKELELRVTGSSWQVVEGAGAPRPVTLAARSLSQAGGFGFLVRSGELEVRDVRSRVVRRLDSGEPPAAVGSGRRLHAALRRRRAGGAPWEIVVARGGRMQSRRLDAASVELQLDDKAARPNVVRVSVSDSFADYVVTSGSVRPEVTIRVAGVNLPVADYRHDASGRTLVLDVDAGVVPDQDLRALEAP